MKRVLNGAEKRCSLPHSPVDSPTLITEITGQPGPLSAVSTMFDIFLVLVDNKGWKLFGIRYINMYISCNM